MGTNESRYRTDGNTFLIDRPVINAEGALIVLNFNDIVSNMRYQLSHMGRCIQMQFNALDYLVAEVDRLLYKIDNSSYHGIAYLQSIGLPNDVAYLYEAMFKELVITYLRNYMDDDIDGTYVIEWLTGTACATLRIETLISRQTYLALIRNKTHEQSKHANTGST